MRKTFIGISALAVFAATAATAIAATLTSNALKERGDLLMSLLQKINQIANDTTVATVEESSSNTIVSNTTGTMIQ